MGSEKAARAAKNRSVPDTVRRLGNTLVLPYTMGRALSHGIRQAYRLYHPLPGRPGRTPGNNGLANRSMSVTTTRDRIRLEAWVVPGEGPHTMVVCHGVERSRSSTLGHIGLLHRAGHHVVAYDMRNHGRSGRDRCYRDMSRRYTSDLADVVRAVAADPELGSGHIGVLGLSFSAWTSLCVAREPGVSVRAVVADSGPAFDIGSGLDGFAALRRGALPRALQDGLGFTFCQWVFRTVASRMLDLGEWPPDLSGTGVRLMFVAGAKDPLITEDQVRRVASAYPDASFWTAPNSLHMNALRFDRDEYEKRVLEFLELAFTEGEPGGESGGPHEGIRG